jgi:Tol biopolymer transport system component
MRKLASVILVTVCLAVGMVSCGDDDGTGVEGTGNIEVTLNMTGSDLDPDGCTVSVDDLVARAIEAGGSVTFADIEVGVHGVHLYDLSGNCVVSGENPRAVSVAAGQTSETTFEVTCAVLTGTLEVLTLTLGDTLDPDGYTLTLDGAASGTIGLDDNLKFSDLAAGSHSVELGDVAVNCGVSGSNSRTLSVVAGLTTLAVFRVTCRAALFDRIAFASTRDGNWEIYVMDADGSNPVNLTENPAQDRAPAWSPDGTRIAFTSTRGGNYEIYVMDADGSNLVRLTNHGAWDDFPAWSPEGTRIAFMTYRDGSYEIYVMDADGSNTLNLTDNPADDVLPAWSPDGTRIAFMTDRDGGNREFYVMDADGSNPVNLTNNPAYDSYPAWSPDGTRIAFLSNRNGVDGIYGDYEIYVMDADGSNPVNLTDNSADDLSPAWSPDGTRIAFRRQLQDNNYEIYVMDADGSNPMRLTNNPAYDDWPTWSPGSQQR